MTHVTGHSSLDDIVDRFAAVSLEDLDDIAALQARVDRKYVVNVEQACKLLCTQIDRLESLDIKGQRLFEYRSTYFDTDDLLSYRTTAHGQRKRFKIRTRQYLDNDARFLEVKTRGCRDETIKTRMPCSDSDVDQLGPEYALFIREVLEGSVDVAALSPKVSTSYRRLNLLERNTNSRVTVDVNLAFENMVGLVQRFDSIVIIETKSPCAPTEIDRALWARGVRPTRISKFGIAMALMNDGLAANRWNRVLRSHFGWEPVSL